MTPLDEAMREIEARHENLNKQATVGGYHEFVERRFELNGKQAHEDRGVLLSELSRLRSVPSSVDGGMVTRREFENELGNRITITISGPKSVSENILTPREACELHTALSRAAEASPRQPHMESRALFEGEIGREPPEPQYDWVPLAKALFAMERNPAIKDQAWFDFQGKAQRIIAKMEEASPRPAVPSKEELREMAKRIVNVTRGWNNLIGIFRLTDEEAIIETVAALSELARRMGGK